MRRLLLLASAALLFFAAPASGGKQPARVQVLAREFSFAVSSKNVRKGDVTIELANFGFDPHNLQVKRIKDGSLVGGMGDVGGGGREEVTINLKPGKYELYCSVANHEALGMQALLKVKS